MFDDELIDSPELRELRDVFTGVALAERPPLKAITARGGERVRRRRSAIALTSAAVLAVGVTLVLGLNDGGARTAPTLTHHTIRTAAYTIVMNADGTATLTISPNELFDATTLQRDLANDGIPSKVTVGHFCASDPAPGGVSQVVAFDPGGPGPEHPATLTIDPAAMSAGTELSVGEIPLDRGMVLAAVGLIDAKSYDCSTDASTVSDLQKMPGVGAMFIAIPATPDTSAQ